MDRAKAIVVASLLTGCQTQASQANSDAIETAACRAADSPFPWPRAHLPEHTDPGCKLVIERMNRGLGLEDDFHEASVCVLDLIEPSEVTAFTQRVQEHRKGSRFIRVERARVPAELVQEADASWIGADRIGLYASLENQCRLDLEEEHLGAGGWRGLCIPWQELNGHYGVTRQAAEQLNAELISAGKPRAFSDQAVRVVADAAQDPDIFQWDTMAAHGQTGECEKGEPITSESSQQCFVGWVQEHLRYARDACASGNLSHSLYWLGFALHSVEDLASHRGRTNAEHAYNAYLENKNPDELTASEQLAQHMALRFMRATTGPGGAVAACSGAFGRFDQAAVTYVDKVTTLKLTRDLTRKSIREYKDSRHAFQQLLQGSGGTPATGLRIRWFGSEHEPPAQCDGVCDELLVKALSI
jgi:hypothetical protein